MSLLAKFFNQIKSSQEDIASDGLKHILQNSIYAKNYLKNSIFTKTNIELPELNYTNQISKTELGRTDISGLDINGEEILIIEAKFWASLTENQPISYLKRLKENSILLFVCPTLRKNSLFVELKKKLTDENIPFKPDNLILKLSDTMKKENSLELDNLIKGALYQRIDVVTRRVTNLIEMQLTIADEIYEKNNIRYNLSIIFSTISIFLSLIVQIILAFIISNNIKKSLKSFKILFTTSK